MRAILFALLAWIVSLVVRAVLRGLSVGEGRRTPTPPGPSPGSRPQPQPPRSAARLVACPVCGVRFPETGGVVATDGVRVCSTECASSRSRAG